jgi:hypothetical protein
MFYRRQGQDGEIWFQDRGEIIVNTHWIGKAQEFIDFDSDKEADVQKRTFKRPNTRNF